MCILGRITILLRWCKRLNKQKCRTKIRCGIGKIPLQQNFYVHIKCSIVGCEKLGLFSANIVRAFVDLLTSVRVKLTCTVALP